MRVLKTAVVQASEDFRRNLSRYENLLADLKKHLALVRGKAGTGAPFPLVTVLPPA